jgi:hypothetical protein
MTSDIILFRLARLLDAAETPPDIGQARGDLVEMLAVLNATGPAWCCYRAKTLNQRRITALTNLLFERTYLSQVSHASAGPHVREYITVLGLIN